MEDFCLCSILKSWHKLNNTDSEIVSFVTEFSLNDVESGKSVDEHAGIAAKLLLNYIQYTQIQNTKTCELNKHATQSYNVSNYFSEAYCNYIMELQGTNDVKDTGVYFIHVSIVQCTLFTKWFLTT